MCGQGTAQLERCAGQKSMGARGLDGSRGGRWMPRRTRRLCAQGESVRYRSGAVHERRHAPRDSSYKYPANLCSFRVLVLLSLGPLAHPRSAAAEAHAQLSLLVEVAETLGRGPSESRVLTMRMPSLSLCLSLSPPPLWRCCPFPSELSQMIGSAVFAGEG